MIDKDRVRQIFHDALAQPRELRGEFLREVCNGAPELRDAVNELLSAYDAAPSQLDRALVSGWGIQVIQHSSDQEDGPDLRGERFGAYRLLRPVGRGGMGEVWLGERADGQYEGQVAVKLVQGAGSSDLVRRFRMEQQTLAALKHPNIARLLDAGTANNRHSYIVMEYVDGVPIDRFCDDRKLSVRARVGLFLEVCDAVQYAHRNLIVHRDLKPGNILVDSDGRPKLLDFGIAKLMRADGQDAVESTQTVTRVFTPGYASPEQLRGRPVTTATDVYALGAVLFELLTGQKIRPPVLLPGFEESGALDTQPNRPSKVIGGMIRASRGASGASREPAADSIASARGVSAERLARLVRGDLDLIVLKALRSEPERRYVSVEQFAEDLRRHLDHKPITARPDTRRYRTIKFVQRNKALVATITVAVLGLSATTLGMYFALGKANYQQRVAKGTSDFFVRKFLESVDPKRGFGKDVKLHDVLDNAAATVDKEMNLLPEAQANVRKGIGTVYYELGEYAKAETELRQALSLREQVFGKGHERTAQSLNDLGALYNALGRHAEAEPLLRRALDIRLTALGRRHSDTVNSMHNLAGLYHTLGRLRDAALLFEETIALRRVLESDLKDGSEELRKEKRSRLTSIGNLGIVYRDLGRYDDAEKLLSGGLEELKALPKSDGGGEESPLALVIRMNLASVHEKTGNYALAASMFEKVLETQTRVLGAQHAKTAQSMYYLALTRFDQEQFTAAEPLLREAIEIQKRALKPTHVQVLESQVLLVRICETQEKIEEAVGLCESAIAAARETLPGEHWQRGVLLGACGPILMRHGQVKAGESAIREAAGILEKALGRDHAETLRVSQFKVGLSLGHGG